MEVIKNNYNELINVTCHHCGSILRCTQEEQNTCACPICGKSLKDHVEENSNSEKEEVYEMLECEKCGHEFLSSPEEAGEYGLYYTYCPRCNAPVYFNEGIDITADNLKKEHFYSMGEGAKEVSFLEIKEWIKKGINYLKKSDDHSWYWYTCSGDSLVLVTRDEDEFYVMWTNKYKDVFLKG